MVRIKIALFLGIVFIAACLRLWQLGTIPEGTTNDEAAYIYSSYSIWKTGHDPTGRFLPLSINLDNSFSPVYIYLDAPFVGILGISAFSGRLPYALLGIGTVVLIYFTARELFRNDKLALLCMSTLAISPWHVHISRGAWDATVALFFSLLFLYLFITKVKKGSILLSQPAFLLAFYSYHATKVYLLFLLAVLFLIYKKYVSVRRKEFLLFLLGIFLIFLSFFYITKTESVTRDIVFLTNDFTSASKMVNGERDKNTAPFFVRIFLSNKALYYLRVVRENYLEAFSPQFLFLYGETGGLGGTYGTFFRGVMYIIELPLLLLGCIYLLKYRSASKELKKILLSSLLIAPLPSTFTIDRTYVMRSVMMLPILTIMVGCGLYYYFQILKSKRRHICYLGILFIATLYLFLVTEYLYQYYFRYPVYGAESWFKSSKDVSLFLKKNQKSYKNIYIAGAGSMFLFQYGLHNKIDPNLIQKAWQAQYPKKIENIWLLEDCLQKDKKYISPYTFLPTSSLYIVPDSCHKNFNPSSTIRDKGEPLRVIWKIYSRD